MATESTSVRKQLVVDKALETKFHGLVRTVGNRHPILKVLWLMAFLALVGVLIRQFVIAVLKLNDKPVATSIEPNSATFIFPDIHICSSPMVSASYPSVMSPEAKNYTTTQMAKVAQLLSSVNASSIYSASLVFVETVPYKFLSDNFGMRKEQTFIKATVVPMNYELRLGTDILDLRHYKYLNCFTVRPQQGVTMKLLENVLGYIDMALFADATYNQTVRLYSDALDARGLSFVYYEALLGSGFRIYFTPRGAYPDDYSPSVTVSPGYTHFIKLSMEVSQIAEEKGQCLRDTPDVQFLEPSTLQPVNYAYNLPACYASQLIDSFNITMKSYLPGIFPLPYAYKDMTSAYNFSRFNANSSIADIQNAVILMQMQSNGSLTGKMLSYLTSMQANCQNKAPCVKIVYKPSLSSIRSPLKQGLKTELSALLRSTTGQNYSAPGRDWLMSLLDKATVGNSSSIAAELNLIQAVTENLVRIQIRAGELTSTEISQSVSYKVFELTVEVGGLMSLFIGGSILTLLELIEFCAFFICGWRLKREEKPDGSQIILVEPKSLDKQ